MIKFIIIIFSLIMSFNALFANDLYWKVKKGEIKETKVYSGEILAKNKISIYAPRINSNVADTLTIQYIPDDGTKVKKGDTLIAFEDSDIRIKYSEKKNEYDIAIANYKQEKSNLEMERISLILENDVKKMELEKAKLAVVEGDILSKIELEKAKLDVEARKLEYETGKKRIEKFSEEFKNTLSAVELKVDMAKKEMNELEEILKSIKIISPIDGITYKPFTQLNWEKSKAERGKVISSGDLILELPDINTFESHLYISQSDIQNIRVGDIVTNSLIAFPGLKISGRVSFVDSFVVSRNDRLGTKRADGYLSEIHAIVSFDRQDERMRPGMTTRSEINSIIAKNVLYVPIISLIREDDKSFVKMKNGKKREVETGISSSNFIEIKSGLNEGEEIKL